MKQVQSLKELVGLFLAWYCPRFRGQMGLALVAICAQGWSSLSNNDQEKYYEAYLHLVLTQIVRSNGSLTLYFEKGIFFFNINYEKLLQEL